MSPLPLWFKGLNPELRRHAELTIGETQEVKTNALAELRRLLGEQNDIHARQDDVFLLQFLRTRKFNPKKAFQLLRNFYTFKAKQNGALAGPTPSQLKNVMEMNSILYLPHRVPSGSHVAVYRMGHYDFEMATLQEFISCALIIIEIILECEATQVCGGIIIFDLQGMTLRHYRQFVTLHFISFLVNALQDVMPERLKGIHFLNEPLLANALFRAIKPLLKKKIKERIHFHGPHLESLHKHVSKEYLPEEYGGSLGPYDNKDFAKYFYSQEEFIKRINKYGLVKTGN